MNQFDPAMQVTVIDVSQGVPPEILYFNMGPKHELHTYEPNFDLDVPAYIVPRDYAERLLENAGGRTFLLYAPNTLIIRKGNGKGGISYVTLKAVKNVDGKWLEKSDEEIKKEGTPAVSQTMTKIMDAAEVVVPPPPPPEPPKIDLFDEEKPIRGSRKGR